MKYYIVGGYVRDELLGIKSKDLDFAVEAVDYWEMREDIFKRGYTVWQERPEFLSIRAKHPTLGPADFTVCRKDGFYSDARHPDTVHIGNIYDDLARRDFTINAIASPEEFRIGSNVTYYDPFDGIRDIKTRTLRCVGRAKERFEEDPLRILRAVRFMVTRGFRPNLELDSALRNNSNLLLTLPIERVYEELKKCYEIDTWTTIDLLDEYPNIKYTVFHDMKLYLLPDITPRS